MLGTLRSLGSLASPRSLLAMSLVVGSLSGLAGRGTLAFFTSQVVSSANTFSGGTVDIAGLLSSTGSTASVATTSVFSWNTTGASSTGSSTNCAHINNTLTDIQNQRMAPGHYCVAPIDINNNNTNSLDAWLRLRLVRSTAVGAAATAEEDAAIEALNDRLKFYMHEYTATYGSGTVTGFTNAHAAAAAARNADCTPANYKPTWTQAATGDTTRYNYVPGTSSGQISSGAPPSGATTGLVSGVTVTYSSPQRTALNSLGTIGKNLGSHPGISAVTVAGSTGPYNAAQDAIALDLVNVTDETVVSAAASKNGLRLTSGTSTGISSPATATVTDAAPTEGNMSTALASRNAYNLIGNDEVTNPVTGATANNGTNPAGNSTEATIAKGERRFFCAAIFFPIDTDQSMSTVYGTTTVVGSTAGLGRTYATSYASGQYTNCMADQVATTGAASAGCASLGNVDAALTAQNGKGDNAASGGNVTYYMVLSAAQKAGRTTP